MREVSVQKFNIGNRFDYVIAFLLDGAVEHVAKVRGGANARSVVLEWKMFGNPPEE